VTDRTEQDHGVHVRAEYLSRPPRST
jgi:hypothetical protein